MPMSTNASGKIQQENNQIFLIESWTRLKILLGMTETKLSRTDSQKNITFLSQQNQRRV